MRLVALLLLLPLAVPLAAAQLPGTPCGPISVPSQPTTPEAVAAGEQVTLTLEVQNDGSVAATVTATAAVATSGWSVISSPDPASIAAGASGTFSFLVEATQDATQDATVSFSASGACDTPFGATCPGNLCNAGSVNAQVIVAYREPQGFRIPGLESLALPVEYLIAGVVLIGLATAIPFAMRRRHSGVLAQCPEPLKMVKAGRGTSFPIEIRNPAREAKSVTFEVGPVPEGWSAFMPTPEAQLAARESRSLWLMVRSPPTANIGEAVEVELRVRDPRAKDGRGAVRVRAEVQSGPE